MAEVAAPRPSGLSPRRVGVLVGILSVSALTGALHYAGTADLDRKGLQRDLGHVIMP